MNDTYLHKQSLHLIAALLNAGFELEISDCSFVHVNTHLAQLQELIRARDPGWAHSHLTLFVKPGVKPEPQVPRPVFDPRTPESREGLNQEEIALLEVIERHPVPLEFSTRDFARHAQEVIEAEKVIDWHRKFSVQARMRAMLNRWFVGLKIELDFARALASELVECAVQGAA